jgi:aspartyl/glutamyl-tRNA(Asn/Gln) amidotransferase C subunit
MADTPDPGPVTDPSPGGSGAGRAPEHLDRDRVAHLAGLARIALTPAEMDRLAGELSVVLDAVAQVQEVATADVPATSHPVPLRNVVRPDVPLPGLTQAEALSGAPAVVEGRFRVPAHPRGGLMADDLTRLSAAAMSEALAAGQVSSVELTTAALERIDAVDGDAAAGVHAFLHVARDEALATARASTTPGRRGATWPPWPGVPVAVKDVVATRGMPTTVGSRILTGWVPPYDATLVTRLREAGTPLLGKTNMDEFAMGSSTEHSAYGPTRNPWDPGRIPGGSGGGSAAAVAAFEAPLAVGTDTGGSIRQPAAVTGSVGVKPTYGGVSRYGLVALASSLDQAGPCARSVLDAALLHEAIGGHDPRDSTSLPGGPPPVVAAARQGAAGDLAGVRVGPGARARRRGLPARRPGPVRRGGRAPAGRRRRGRRGVRAALPLRPGGVLPDPAERGQQQPGQVRRHAVRSAGGGLRPRRDGRAGHGGHPRGGLRRRGQAPDRPGHLRLERRLLRRLLRQRAEGPHPGAA